MDLGHQAAFSASSSFLPSITFARTGLALDGDAARLHRLGQLTLEVALQDAVGQRRTDDLDVIDKAEAALESLATL